MPSRNAQRQTGGDFGGGEREEEVAGLDGLADREVGGGHAAHDPGGEGGALKRADGGGEGLR